MSLLLATIMTAISSLEASADAVAAKAVTLEAPLGVYVSGPDAVVTRTFGSALTSRLAEQHQSPVLVEATTPAEAEQQARARGLRSLLRLEVKLEADQLVVRGDGLSTWVNFWAGKTPSRAAGAVVVADAQPIDAELRTLAGLPTTTPPPEVHTGPLKLEFASLGTLPFPPAALGVGDLDGDGVDEIAALVGNALWLWSGAGKLIQKTELAGAESASPTREPFGVIAFEPGRVLVWSGRRAKAEVFAWQGAAVRGQGAIDDVQGLKLEPGVTRVLVDAAKRGVMVPTNPQAFSTRGSINLAQFGDGTAALARAGTFPTSRLAAVGAGSTLGDFDGDGSLELLASSTRLSPDGDDLRIIELSKAESAQSRGASVLELPLVWQAPLGKGRVVTAASGHLDAAPGDEAVLGVWHVNGTGELIVLRRSAP